MQVTATLKNAYRVGDDIRSPNIRGQIYGDTRNRFSDGTWIYTSRIQEELPENIFKTLYSVYKVEFAEGKYQ